MQRGISSKLQRPLRRALMRRATHTVEASQPGKIIVAVDGPAASGKGTLAKTLATTYNLAHLDTGLLYRSIGMKAVRSSVGMEDENSLEQLCIALTPADLADPDLRSDEAATAASKVSVFPKVRAALLEFQRAFARSPPAEYQGTVLDGRDIGTVVCPDAHVKLFITADVEVRAERRWKEMQNRGQGGSLESILAAMRERDERDSQRAAAPLKAADDAVVLDTSLLSADQVLQAACGVVERWGGGVKRMQAA